MCFWQWDADSKVLWSFGLWNMPLLIFQIPFCTLGLHLIMKTVWYLRKRSIYLSSGRSCLNFPFFSPFSQPFFASYYIFIKCYSCVCITHFHTQFCPWIVFTLSYKPVWIFGISYLNCPMVLEQLLKSILILKSPFSIP